MIITIDGPAGTGKTTVARRVAECLHFPYFDTGAMYRSVTWKILKEGISLNDRTALETLLHDLDFRIEGSGTGKKYFIGSEDVSQKIRGKEVTSFVSEVSADPLVREKLWEIQRSFGAKGDAVFEGRDMGTVVFPEAEIKIYLTASPEVRAQRRLEETLANKNAIPSKEEYDQMLASIMKRDHYDSTREIAPLRKPEDAYEIDTTQYSIDEVVELILKYKHSYSRL